MPDPPIGAASPRLAAGLSLCQEKPQFLLTRDQYGLVIVYKRKMDQSPGKGLPESPVAAEPEGPPVASGGSLGASVPFVELQLQLEHGPVLDSFWLPPMPQGRDGRENKDLSSMEKTEGGCFFVTVQQRRVAIWSVPLLRSLAVTLSRHPNEDALLVRFVVLFFSGVDRASVSCNN